MNKKILIIVFCAPYQALYPNKLDDFDNQLESYKNQINATLPTIFVKLGEIQQKVLGTLGVVNSKKKDLQEGQQKIKNAYNLIISTKKNINDQKLIPDTITAPLFKSLELQENLLLELEKAITAASGAINTLISDSSVTLKHITVVKVNIINLTAYLNDLIDKIRDVIKKIQFKI